VAWARPLVIPTTSLLVIHLCTSWYFLSLTWLAKMMSTGDNNIDAVVGGGIYVSSGIMGKTQLAIQLALQVQLPPGKGGLGKGKQLRTKGVHDVLYTIDIE